jgi:orotidine-5'-phosphate decarboxylase
MQKPSGFREALAARQEKINSLLCVGIDPLEEKLPFPFVEQFGQKSKEAMMMWLMDYVDATAPFASMFKPQSAFYEGMEHYDGRDVLKLIVAYIHRKYPDIPVFLDCKRGDIKNTQKRYAVAHLFGDGVDGMNYSPYMSEECLSALVDVGKNGDALVSLCYTSNPTARQTQEVILRDGRMYWEFIAQSAMEWSEKHGVLDNAGLVMAAAYERPKGSGEIYSLHLSRGREIVDDKMWFLIPGIGTQGGFVAETVKNAYVGPGSIAINSSSGLLFKSRGDDYANASAGAAEELRDQIRAAAWQRDV